MLKSMNKTDAALSNFLNNFSLPQRLRLFLSKKSKVLYLMLPLLTGLSIQCVQYLSCCMLENGVIEINTDQTHYSRHMKKKF